MATVNLHQMKPSTTPFASLCKPRGRRRHGHGFVARLGRGGQHARGQLLRLLEQEELQRALRDRDAVRVPGETACAWCREDYARTELGARGQGGGRRDFPTLVANSGT